MFGTSFVNSFNSSTCQVSIVQDQGSIESVRLNTTVSLTKLNFQDLFDS